MTRISQLVFVVLLLVGCNSKKVETKVSKIYVKSEVVTSNDTSVSHNFHGVIAEKEDVLLSFRVGGPMNKLAVEVGDYVKKGQLIAGIDERDYRIQLRQTEAQLTQRKAEFKRYDALYKKGKLPANNYDQCKMALDLAQISFDNANNQLNDTKLFAPFSGYVTVVMADQFETVGPGMPILSLIDVSEMEILINAPSSQLSMFKENVSATADIESVGINNTPLVFKSVSQKAGKDDLYEARFRISCKSDRRLRPGMVAEISVNEIVESNTILNIPLSAVFEQSGVQKVWVINNQTKTVHSKDIRISKFETNGRVSVINGVKSNDRIVTAGVHSLHEGQKVEIIKAKSETNIGGLL